MNKLMLPALLVVLVVLGLGGCSTTGKGGTSANLVPLAEHVNFMLTAPPETLIGKQQSHLIAATFAGKVRRFIAQVEYSDRQISLAAVSVTGLPLFDFIWHRDKPLKLNQYLPLPGLDIKYMIADMQWINWPLVRLKSSLNAAGISVTQTQQGQQNWRRSVSQNGKLILQIEKTGNDYLLEHELRQYSIKITDLGGGAL